jgi:hypothetical protein
MNTDTKQRSPISWPFIARAMATAVLEEQRRFYRLFHAAAVAVREEQRGHRRVFRAAELVVLKEQRGFYEVFHAVEVYLRESERRWRSAHRVLGQAIASVAQMIAVAITQTWHAFFEPERRAAELQRAQEGQRAQREWEARVLGGWTPRGWSKAHAESLRRTLRTAAEMAARAAEAAERQQRFTEHLEEMLRSLNLPAAVEIASGAIERMAKVKAPTEEASLKAINVIRDETIEQLRKLGDPGENEQRVRAAYRSLMVRLVKRRAG